MVGIDLYGWDYKDTGIYEFWHGPQSYKQALDVRKQLAPDKLIILTETDAMPNMEKTFDDNDPNFAKWLWAMPWWAGDENNPDEWIKQTYTHEKVIMQPDLPDFSSLSTGNIDQQLNDSRQQFSLYPVPCSDFLNIEPIDNFKLAVYNSYGEFIDIKKFASGINVHDLEPGFYFLKITSEEQQYMRKFIKR